MELIDRDGFTMVEMLVTMVVLSIFMLGLAQFYSTFVVAAQKSLAFTTINQNLDLVTHRIVNHLKSTGRNRSLRKLEPYEFVGVDGTPSGFHNADTTPHNQLSSQPNEHSDRLHFHAFEPYAGLAKDTSTARTYIAYWINGEDSPKTASQMEGRWGVLMRKKYHENGDTLPYYPANSGRPSPLLDLNQASTRHDNMDAIGTEIDYLSFQYYDPVTDDWYDEWDTVDTSNFPSDNRIPSAVKVAIRAYDSRANKPGASDEMTVQPQWNQETISLRTGR